MADFDPTTMEDDVKIVQSGRDSPVTSTEASRGPQRYGWCKLTPDWLQFLNTPFWFLVMMSVAVTAESMLVNGLIGVSISSIETRFDLSSSKAGAIPGVYELGGIPFMLAFGYFGSRLHRPRWIAFGMLLLSVASLLFVIPHFSTDTYKWGGEVQDNLCHVDSNVTACGDHTESSTLSDYLYMFITAAFLMSIGATPVYLLGVPYIDDCLSSHAAPCYLGVFYAMSSLGPAIAYIGGGLLLEIYTDFSSVDDVPLKSNDPRWVGAWWIGFLFTWALCLVTVMPIAAYPNTLPGTEEMRKAKMGANMAAPTDDDVTSVQPGFVGTCKELPSVLKDLFTNLPFVFSVLAHVGDGMIVIGFTIFGPKYVENQFSVSASLAAIIFGVIVVPGAVGGTILGGWIIKRWKLSCEGCLRTYVIIGVIVLCLVSMFFVQCDNAKFAGVSVFPHNESQKEAVEQGIHFQCNDHCQCSEERYEPICGSDNLVYFSPCFAGCSEQINDGDTLYPNCSCINNGATATPGVCSSSYCQLMPLFLTVLLVGMIFIFVAGLLHLQIGLRCVRGDSRPLAMSVDTIVGRLMGSFPAPLLFGAALDASCILWEEKCDHRGSCLYYDNHQMAWYMLSLCVGCKIVNVVFGFLAWWVYKYRGKHDDGPQILRENSVARGTTYAESAGASSAELANVVENSRATEAEPTDVGSRNGGFEIPEENGDASQQAYSTATFI